MRSFNKALFSNMEAKTIQARHYLEAIPIQLN